jgi:pyruvate, water dikinase
MTAKSDKPSSVTSVARFPSPLDVPIPAECEGWEEFYSYDLVFSEDRRTFDEGRFWFQDALHFAEPYHPFDSILQHFITAGINQASARLFVVPSSLGSELRILNGYVYLSGNSVTDGATLAQRAELFVKRSGHYYKHWDALDARWREKVEAELRDLATLRVPDLPEVEDESIVLEGRGLGSGQALAVAYDRLLEGFDRICSYHFALLGLGYGAFLALDALLRESFPEISDQTITKMVSGLEVLVLRPDEELKRLARPAVELGIAGQVRDARGEEELRTALAASEEGARWLADGRAHPGMARVSPGRRRHGDAARHSCVLRCGRGDRARHLHGRPAARGRRGRDPRRVVHLDQLDARVRQDRGGGHGRRRRHVPRRHRRP